jgi:hypothetical protein
MAKKKKNPGHIEPWKSEAKFKSCPFCGGQPKTTVMGPDNEWKCGNEKCPIYGIKMHSSAWNTRQPEQGLVEALEEILEFCHPSELAPPEFLIKQIAKSAKFALSVYKGKV